MSKYKLLPVVLSVIVLFSINILMLSSLAPDFVSRQLISWSIGLILFFVGTQINPKQTTTSRWLFFIVSCILLLSPILLNNITRGSRRWLDIGPLSLQPSEIVKPLLMLFLSTTQQPLFHLLPVGIILAQPDLGSSITVFLLLTPLIIFNKKLLKLFMLLFVVGLLFSPIIWNNLLHDYQKNRVINFLDPNRDPLGAGYNVLQSKIAVGSGGLWGKGYRQGSQGQLLFLPEKHTDFMFAATAEELGLLGVIIILTAYFFLIKSLISKTFNTINNPPLLIFTLGITIQIWAQIFINIGMNLGLLPVTGIPLPFLSLGGSSIMALLFSLGIIYSS